MNHSMPGLPVHHQLPEFTKTHVHRVSDAIQPSHPLSSPSPTAFNLSQNQGLFQCLHKKSTKHFLKFLVKCLRGMRYPVTISQFSSVAQLCLTLCDPMNHSMPGLPVHHQLPQLVSLSEKCKSKPQWGTISPLRMAAIQKSTSNKCLRGCGEKGTLLHFGGNAN